MIYIKSTKNGLSTIDIIKNGQGLYNIEITENNDKREEVKHSFIVPTIQELSKEIKRIKSIGYVCTLSEA